MLTVMDEFTREGLAIDVDTSTSAERVIGVLVQLVAAHGAPVYLRSDNGSEFVAVVVQAWLAQQQIQTLGRPGFQWQLQFCTCLTKIGKEATHRNQQVCYRSV